LFRLLLFCEVLPVLLFELLLLDELAADDCLLACLLPELACTDERPDEDEGCDLWTEDCCLEAEGCDLWTEDCCLEAEGCDLWTEDCCLEAEGCDLWTEDCCLGAEGCDLWTEDCCLGAEGCDLWTEDCCLEAEGADFCTVADLDEADLWAEAEGVLWTEGTFFTSVDFDTGLSEVPDGALRAAAAG